WKARWCFSPRWTSREISPAGPSRARAACYRPGMWTATLAALLGLAVAGEVPPERALVLTGGTLVDVSGFGSSLHDVRDAVVVMRGGEILAAGPRTSTEIPAGAEVVRIDGAYVVP